MTRVVDLQKKCFPRKRAFFKIFISLRFLRIAFKFHFYYEASLSELIKVGFLMISGEIEVD